jgi:hypothetical protein
MTIEQTLWVWFLLNYALGIAGFLRNVVRVGRYRAVFEVQIGHLPPVDALIAWLLPPLILLSRAGAISAERPIYSCYRYRAQPLRDCHGDVDRTNARPLSRSRARGLPRPCSRHLRAVPIGPSSTLLGCLSALAWGSVGDAELASARTLAAARGRRVQRATRGGRNVTDEVRGNLQCIRGADRSLHSQGAVAGTAERLTRSSVPLRPRSCIH